MAATLFLRPRQSVLSVGFGLRRTVTIASTALYLQQKRKMSFIEGPQGTTLFRELFKDNPSDGPNVINMVQGAPGVRHLQDAEKMINKSAQSMLSGSYAADGCVLQYGPRSGSPRAREAVASFLSEGYADKVNGDDIIITSGATHGLHLVVSLMLRSGAPVFVEDPTYFIAINMLKGDFGMNIVPVISDDGGVVPESLDEVLTKQHSDVSKPVTDKQPFWGLLYLVPTYNNPRGFCMSPDRCKEIIKVARKHDILVFCDDVYNLLHYDMESVAPPRLLTYDNPSDPGYKGNVLSNGTFSKIMGPGLRCGWIESGERINHLLKTSNTLWSAGSSNHFTSEMIATAILMGLEQEFLKKMRQEYKMKIQHLVDILKTNLPDGCSVNHPEGGYFLWVQLPEHADSAELAKDALEKYHVRILPGRACSPTGSYANCVRLSFSYLDEEYLLEGARRFCTAVKQYLDEKK